MLDVFVEIGHEAVEQWEEGVGGWGHGLELVEVFLDLEAKTVRRSLWHWGRENVQLDAALGPCSSDASLPRPDASPLLGTWSAPR